MKTLAIILLLLLPTITCTKATFTQTWTNPLTLDQEWERYGIGDPYILKYKGVFYLYCSTRDYDTGIKVWSSRDLVSWHYEGLCTTEPLTRGAYAPEVIYWNGTFYMYTSPAGNGHFVLASDSPTGPFVPISGNIGRSIDGSVFIGDDAQWYFYYASPGGIRGARMNSPTTMEPSSNINAVMNNSWTEGATVFKRNGIYYITYTGNHIWSPGYRIDYAMNSTGPLARFQPATSQNPIILNTDHNHFGLGHGSVFIGPDLDSYFFTYHNLLNRHGQGLPWRKVNFDRIAWNGEKLIVLGPTTFAQQAPEMPDAFDFFDRADIGETWEMPLGGNWKIENAQYLYQYLQPGSPDQRYIAILRGSTEDNFTAEFNFRQVEAFFDNAKTGAVFNYRDIENYGYAAINSQTNQLEINFIKNNIPGTPRLINIPYNFDYAAWQVLRIEKMGSTYKFFYNNMHLATISGTSEPGKMGYLSENNTAMFSFIAFSNKVNGSGVFDIYKPVPGSIDAVLYNAGGQGHGFNIIGSSAPNVLRMDGIPITKVGGRGGYAIQSLGAGEWLKYNINIRSTGKYNLGVTYASITPKTTIRYWLGDTQITGEIELTNTGTPSEYRNHTIHDIELPAGHHTLKVEIVSGSINLYSHKFVLALNTDFDHYINFDGGLGIGWRYMDGIWTSSNGAAIINGTGKRTYGQTQWADYMVETNLRFHRNMNAGILLRVNNPALGGPGTDADLGTDFLQGYFIGFNFGAVVLGKHNYNWQLLASSPGNYRLNTWYHVRATIQGNDIRVYVDDMETPVIIYSDSIPFLTGRAGLRSFNTHVEYNDFRVTSKLTATNIYEPLMHSNLPIVYPNPLTSALNIHLNDKIIDFIQILTMDGREVFYKSINDINAKLNLSELAEGMYLLRIFSENTTYSRKIKVGR